MFLLMRTHRLFRCPWTTPAVVMSWRQFIFSPSHFFQDFCGMNILCSCGCFALISKRIGRISSHEQDSHLCSSLCWPGTTKFVGKKITSEIKFLLALGEVVVKKSRQTQFITPIPLDKRIAAPEWCYMCSRVHTLPSTSHMHFIRQSIIQTWDANQSEPHFVSLQLRKWREAAFLLLTAAEILLERALVPSPALGVGCMWFHPISCDGHHSVL